MQRAIVFVDGGNFYHGMKRAGLWAEGLNYARLAAKLVQNRQLVETRFYVGQFAQPAPGGAGGDGEIYAAKMYDKQRKFFGELQRQGVVLRLGRIEGELGAWREKAVDVMLAVDMVAMAHKKIYEVAYLLSADGDFTPAVEKVREAGRTVFAASPAYGHKIGEVADKFIPLGRKNFRGCWD